MLEISVLIITTNNTRHTASRIVPQNHSGATSLELSQALTEGVERGLFEHAIALRAGCDLAVMARISTCAQEGACRACGSLGASARP